MTGVHWMSKPAFMFQSTFAAGYRRAGCSTLQSSTFTRLLHRAHSLWASPSVKPANAQPASARLEPLCFHWFPFLKIEPVRLAENVDETQTKLLWARAARSFD